MGLYDDQIEGHVRPGELGELEAIVAFLERGNKEDKTCNGVSRAFTLQIQPTMGPVAKTYQ